MIESNPSIFHLHFSRINLWIRRQTSCLYPYWVPLPYYNHRSTVRRVETKHHSCERISVAWNRSIFRFILHGIYHLNETIHYNVLFSPPYNLRRPTTESTSNNPSVIEDDTGSGDESTLLLVLCLVLFLLLHSFIYTALLEFKDKNGSCIMQALFRYISPAHWTS